MQSWVKCENSRNFKAVQFEHNLLEDHGGSVFEFDPQDMEAISIGVICTYWLTGIVIRSIERPASHGTIFRCTRLYKLHLMQAIYSRDATGS